MKASIVVLAVLAAASCASGGPREVKVRHEYPDATHPNPFGLPNRSADPVFTDNPGDGKPGQ